MHKTIVILASALALPLGLARAQPLGTPLGADEAPLVPTPDGARLIGQSSVDEIRAFPELGAKTLDGGSELAREKLVGVAGIDRAFSTEASYDDTVGWFDARLKHGGYRIRSRVSAPGTTAWIARRPDGSVAEVAVRNTTPTTFEITEVNGKGVDMPQK